MRLAVISDVHYGIAGLAEAADDADIFICLGDLILFLDYDDPGSGIFPDLYGPENTRRYVELRTANRWGEAREFLAGLWHGDPAQRWQAVSERVAAQYQELFALLPAGYLTYGNVDVPALWPTYARPGHRIIDGGVVELGGLRVGFVGGGLPSPMRTPYEIPESEYDAKIAALGEVDILCAHLPPALPELTYDVVARRFERGSVGLLEAIRRTQPRYVLHGHVHQPLQRRTRIGRSEIINVGHFRKTRRPFILEV